VFALSDIHVDYPDNMAWVEALSPTAYRHDALILAGDVSDDLNKLAMALHCVRTKFAQVFFVPGNHELWVRRQPGADSFTKFHQVLELCATLGVQTRPAMVGNAVWIVPLFTWYVRPEEGPDSLFVPKPGEDPRLTRWSDDYFTTWPSRAAGRTIADHFLSLNEPFLTRHYDAPVISCSHFVPRTDLIFSTPAERAAAGTVAVDTAPSFNFSRVAGSWGIEAQIRRLGSVVHVYGHQHRNRRRLVAGVWYVAHSLGYRRERELGQIRGLEHGPTLIWETRRGAPTLSV
jgi:predicted phosphodiesterase